MRLRRFPFELLLVPFGVCLLVFFSIRFQWLESIDRLIYDALLDYSDSTIADEIVIVAIDDQSIDGFGQWPWSRQVHGQLVKKLTDAKAAVIAFDVIFSESDRLNVSADSFFADKMSNHGKVILPVFLDHETNQGQIVEVLPLPILAQAAFGMGHVHVELGDDGVVRSVYLKQGMGTAYWSHIAVVIAEAYLKENVILSGEMPTLRGQGKTGVSSKAIIRHYLNLIPFVGPPGSYPVVSYFDVMAERVPLKDIFKDKIVLVGATAGGLGDYFPVPSTVEGKLMSGVELNANVLSALLNDTFYQHAPIEVELALSLVLVSLSVLLMALVSPITSIALVLLIDLMILVGVVSLLLTYGIWFPPAAAIGGVSISYPLWSWRKVKATNHFLTNELSRLHKEALLWGSTDKTSAVLNQLVKGKDAAIDFRLIHRNVAKVELASQRVSEIRALLISVFSQMQDAVIVADDGGEVVFINEKAQDYFGILSEGKNKLNTVSTHFKITEGSKLWSSVLAGVIQTGQSFIGELRYDNRVDFLFNLSRLQVDVHWPAFIVFLGTDISSVKDNERRKQETIGFLSHDIRSPLVSILSLIDQALRLEIDEDQRAILGKIYDYAIADLSLAEQFLQLTKVEMLEDFDLEPIDIHSVLMNSSEQLYPQSKSKNIEVTFEEEGCGSSNLDTWIKGNGEMLERAFVNVIGNAIKYCPDRSHVKIKLSNPDLTVLKIVIEDDGPGIYPQALPFLFDRFRQEVKGQGAGLGLRFVKVVVEKHDGDISVLSTLGKGTAFVFTFACMSGVS